MTTYLAIVLLAVMIFLCIPDVVEAIARATGEWERARDLSRKHATR